MIEIELGYPPSINHYWRRVGARTLISREGRAYRLAVEECCLQRNVRPIDGPVSVEIIAHPPDRRRRDLDNICKSLLDSLEGKAYHDDSQIVRLTLVKADKVDGGKVSVKIEDAAPQRA